MERHSFCIVLGDSPETMRKLCFSAKFPHQEIRWNYGIFYSVILFTLCAHKSRLYFAVGKKKKTLIFYFYYFFAGHHPPKYISSVRTAKLIIRRWKPAKYFQDVYWFREHKNLENWDGNAICKLQHRHSDTVAYRQRLKKKIQGGWCPLMWGL